LEKNERGGGKKAGGAEAKEGELLAVGRELLGPGGNLNHGLG